MRATLRLLLWLMSCLSPPLLAQTPGLPQDRPSDRRLELPETQPVPAPPVQVPSRPEPRPGTRRDDRLSVYVHSIDIEGNQAIGDDELAAVVAPFVNRRIDGECLSRIVKTKGGIQSLTGRYFIG